MDEKKRAMLEETQLFVLDMDGTIYLGDRLFPYTPKFLQQVRDTGRDFCFFTNNSSKNREAYLEKLARMGISLPPEKMLISNGVILQWLGRHHPGARCYVVGTPALREDFRACNAYARPECEGCWAKLYCSGGCAANAYHATGSIRGVYSYGCDLFRKRMECAIMIQAVKATGGLG